jgi:hypothetical protein
VSSSEITHTRDRHFTGSSATWTFTWTAPLAEGTYTFYGSGLAANDNHSDTGDGWDLHSVTILVDDGCDDLDGDGWEICDDGSGGDCDDGDGLVNPDESETCDGVDQDCDGEIDEDPVSGTEIWPDADGDGYGDDAASADFTCDTTAPEGWSFDDADCDDGDLAINPDAVEVCDGVDNDCDGTIDGPGSADALTFYADADADGYGDVAVTTLECSVPSGYTTDTTDCDDTRPGVNPGATEVCDALDTDEDCDGSADDADADVTGTSTWYADADGDGYGGDATLASCSAPAGYVAITGDCADDDAAFNPAATESCDDPTDYNCDGSTGYADGDGDGHAACVDCDDADATAYVGATEVCDGDDEDCDGTVDEPDASDASVWFVDGDADGYGSTSAAVVSCDQPEGYAANAEDCDDADAGARPDAPETWYDGVDQDCDGADDDQDGDGFALDADCDDTDGAVHPGAEDTAYDGLDSDCAGDSDYDADGDGHDSASHDGDDCDDADAAVYPGAQDEPWDGVITDCDDADEYDWDGDGYEIGEDCDDANSAISPGAEETWYDGIDQDCDGNDDDQDADGVAEAVDCDDTDPALLTDCDTAAPDSDPPDDEGDTGDDGDEKDPGCGCVTGGSPAGAVGLLLALAVTRRGRRINV